MKQKFNKASIILGLALLLGCMALPSAVKLAHALHGHKDIECSKESRLHFHSAEFDCAFHKFNKTTFYYHHLRALTLVVPVLYFEQPLVALPGIVTFNSLPFGLRAPPFHS